MGLLEVRGGFGVRRLASAMAPPVKSRRTSNSARMGLADKLVRTLSNKHPGLVDESGKMHGPVRWVMLVVQMVSYYLVGYLFFGFGKEDWSLKETCYFLTVTFTTVGYGDITPKTDGGKAFAMVYALVGVAVVFPVVLELGQWLVDYLERNILERFKIHEKLPGARTTLTDSLVEPVWPKVSLSVFLVLIPLGVGAAFFSHTHTDGCGENWSEWDAFWWSFATITTIGYGQGRKRVIQRRFNVGVLEAIPRRKASTL